MSTDAMKPPAGALTESERRRWKRLADDEKCRLLLTIYYRLFADHEMAQADLASARADRDRLHARIAELEAALRRRIDGCETCGGSGILTLPGVAVHDNRMSLERQNEPCPRCSPLRAVLGPAGGAEGKTTTEPTS